MLRAYAVFSDVKLPLFICLLKVLVWFIFGLSGRPTWTPPPFVTCGTVQLFFGFFLLVFFCSCMKLHHTKSQLCVIITAQLRSAAQRRAVPRGAVLCRSLPCGAVLCSAVPCCAVLRVLLYFSFVPGTCHVLCC